MIERKLRTIDGLLNTIELCLVEAINESMKKTIENLVKVSREELTEIRKELIK